MWERRAHEIEEVYGGFVDWDERFYLCPYCEEPVYETDWRDSDLCLFLCPICEDEDKRMEDEE